MTYETISVKPLTGALGAEIGGVDLRQPLSNRQRSEIHDAFLAHCAIYIRDQELGGADLLRYARYFAERRPIIRLSRACPTSRKSSSCARSPTSRRMSAAPGTPTRPISTSRRSARCSTRVRSRAYGGDYRWWRNQYLAYERLVAGRRLLRRGFTGNLQRR